MAESTNQVPITICHLYEKETVMTSRRRFQASLCWVLVVLLATGVMPLQSPVLAAPPAASPEDTVAQASGDIVINEFVASNTSGLQDEDGDTSDWIELYNGGVSPVNLGGWALSDDAGEPDKWIVPNRTLDPGDYLVLFASGKNRTSASGELHTSFRLSAAGEFLGLFDNASPPQVVYQFSPQFPAQYADVSYGRYLDAGEHRYFANPTPGAANDNGSAYLGRVSGVSFGVPRGYYGDDNFTVDLQTSTPGASMRHKRRGFAPSESSGTLYDGPVHIYDSMPLRAIAYKDDYLSSPVGTNTYVMPSRVMDQPPDPPNPPFPAHWGTYNGLTTTADYAMDPAVVYDPRYHSTFLDDLRSLPAISIAISPVDMFNAYTGIYANPIQTGIEWERPVSVELINPDGSTEFQVDAGLRIHGKMTRQPDVTPKHSLRLHFRGEYGASQLEHPVFADSPVDRFDVLVLRSMYEDSWLYSDREGVYARDQWVRKTELALGRVAAHTRYVHVYIDGLYWGLYDLTERIDEHFAASYFGGPEEDFDVIHDTGVGIVRPVMGDAVAWDAMTDTAEAGLADPAQYQAIQEYLDVPNLIDFMLVHIYSGNPIPFEHVDWRAIRRREPGGTFKFFCWDSGSFLEGIYLNNADVGADAPNTPAYLYYRLRDNPEFRLLFADHVQRHFFNGGVFYVDPNNPAWDPQHPERNQPAARFAELVQQIDRAVVPESARWGDGALDATEPPFTRDDWVRERDRLLNEVFPQRTAIVLQQLRDIGLYPAVEAPAFNQHGGQVPLGFQLNISAPAGTIYFTTDGSDPRIPGSGAISPSASAFVAPLPLPPGTTPVKARVLDGATWSALTEATFTVLQDFSVLKITEIMYNPPGSDDYEFLELKNTGPVPLNMAGVAFTDGFDYTFPAGFFLDPGSFAVLSSAADPAVFSSRYGFPPDGSYFPMNLANGGERLELQDPVGNVIVAMTYYDGEHIDPRSGLYWPTGPDDNGYSLVIIDPNADPDHAANWRSSTYPNGSPGADDPAPFLGGVVINEILAHSDPPFEDTIELHNPTESDIYIGGWYLSDDFDNLAKFRIPDGTTIEAGGYMVYYEHQFNNPFSPPGNRFALSSRGEQLILTSADPDGNLTNYTDSRQFAASATNTSLGRFTTSTGIDFTALSYPTFGTANAYPTVGPVVFDEIMYRPPTGDQEYLELLNVTDASLPLYDPDNPDNTWRLTDGISYTFPVNTVLPPRGRALVVGVDPAAFRISYTVPISVPIFGPYELDLSNGGERIELARPDSPDAGQVPYIAVDALFFDDVPPWPTTPDGGGASLERLSGVTYPNDPTNWTASPPGGSPGTQNEGCLFADVQPNAHHSSPGLCDGDVDVADVQRVASCWNQAIGSPTCPPTLNIDGQAGIITVTDLIAVGRRWGWLK
jgi:hypothetical protein